MVFVVWVGFPAHLLWDLHVFQSITGHLEENHDLLHDRSDLTDKRGKLFGLTVWFSLFVCLFREGLAFQLALFHFPGELCSSQVIGNIADPLKKEIGNRCFKLLLCLFRNHLQNPVNPDGAVAPLESLDESETRNRKKKQTRECGFKFFCESMTVV